MMRFLAAMERDGYSFEELPSDEDGLLAEMLDKGRNVSTGRPRDLRQLAQREGVLLLPVDGYLRWFDGLPETMRTEVIATFGPPPGDLMTVRQDGKSFFVLPKLDYGNIIVLPQPVRGAAMDAKLQHNDRVPPPHQYLAVYWWLREIWQADAIVNYGTHGTHEFLPGRPLGQLADDWSDRTIGALPNLYVYVMDNVGEALIAKRRGAAVTISHQIPRSRLRASRARSRRSPRSTAAPASCWARRKGRLRKNCARGCTPSRWSTASIGISAPIGNPRSPATSKSSNSPSTSTSPTRTAFRSDCTSTGSPAARTNWLR